MSHTPVDPAASTMEVHFKLFGTDGVSLQSQELSKELRGRGRRVHPCACDVPDGAGGLRLPALSYQSEDAVALRRRIFPPGDAPAAIARVGAALVDEIDARAGAIRTAMERYLDAEQISLVHVRNLMSLPYNLPATLAVHRLATERPDIGFLMQHHDLYWEGPNARSFATPFSEVAELIDRIMCPTLPNARHVLINPIAADALRARKGIDGTVIPDGFDFDREVAVIDELAFRRRLAVLSGDSTPIGADDLVIVMPARVAINKAIELAVQLVSAVASRRDALHNTAGGLGSKRRRFGEGSRVVLMLPQGEDLQDNRAYFDRIVMYARQLGVTLAYGGDIVVPDRRHQAGDPDHYPFYSTYQAADLVCYPPEHEGFGNQAIEAVWAELPLAVLEYPVFKRFVRDHIPHFISLGDTEELGRTDGFGGLHTLSPAVAERAVDDVIAVLRDHRLERTWTEQNVPVLRAFCGIETVADQYIRLYAELESSTRPRQALRSALRPAGP